MVILTQNETNESVLKNTSVELIHKLISLCVSNNQI